MKRSGPRRSERTDVQRPAAKPHGSSVRALAVPAVVPCRPSAPPSWCSPGGRGAARRGRVLDALRRPCRDGGARGRIVLGGPPPRLRAGRDRGRDRGDDARRRARRLAPRGGRGARARGRPRWRSRSLVDLPDVHETGLIGRTYDAARAEPRAGLYLELAGGCAALLGAALILVARPAPRGPVAKSRNSSRSVTPGDALRTRGTPRRSSAMAAASTPPCAAQSECATSQTSVDPELRRARGAASARRRRRPARPRCAAPSRPRARGRGRASGSTRESMQVTTASRRAGSRGRYAAAGHSAQASGVRRSAAAAHQARAGRRRRSCRGPRRPQGCLERGSGVERARYQR